MAPSNNSDPSPHKSNSSDNSPHIHRPKPYSAVTVIPALHPFESSGQAYRSHSSTQSARPSTDLSSRRRAGTTPHIHPTPLDVERATLGLRPTSPHRIASLPHVLSDRPSSPIPIPPRQRQKSPPIVPLTARAHSPVNYFGGTRPRPHISESLTPYYTTSGCRVSASQPASSLPLVQRGFATMVPQPVQGYTPTSPLSPTLPIKSLAGASRAKERRPVVKMNLPGLPKFHPANFPSSQNSDTTPPSPRHARSLTSQPRTSRGSDAQQKLHQYQRELIANATQSSRSLLSERLSIRPDSPRLTPMRSPVDPMTPLALEGQSDYLKAGSSPSSPSFQDDDGREMVERLVRRENERRRHPEARSGSVSPAVSPAVSPVGGCR